MKFRNYKGEMVESPPDRTVVVASLFDGCVVWSLKGPVHQVRYGLEVKTFKDDIEAAKEFGLCVLHCAECSGLYD